MSGSSVESLVQRDYKYGFVTDIEADSLPKGLSEDVVRLISSKKGEPEWLLEWRLKAYRGWLKMSEPHSWPNVTYKPIDYQDIIYYSAPRNKTPLASLDDADPKLIETYQKLGIPLNEQKLLAGVAVDAIFDSVSVGTTYKAKLAEQGIIFCSFSEAVREHPGADPEVPGLRGAHQRQFLCGTQLGGLLGRLLRLHPEGRALSHGALDLLPHQHRGDRPVRADAHRGR